MKKNKKNIIVDQSIPPSWKKKSIEKREDNILEESIE